MAVEHAQKGKYTALKLFKNKKALRISKSTTDNSFEAIVKTVQGQKHLVLIINNEEVLSKTIARTSAAPISMVKNTFPTIKTNDFYYQIHSTEVSSFIAIVRKKVVDQLIEKYRKEGIAVVDFLIGNLAIPHIQEFISHETLYTSNARIKFEAHQIVGIQKEVVLNEYYTINNLTVSNHEVLALGGIIAYYFKNSSELMKPTLATNYIQKQYFNWGVRAGLGVVMGILLINVLFFSTYSKQVEKLSGELQISETYKNQLHSLQNKVLQKKRLVQRVNASAKRHTSAYFDEIGLTTPNNVLLSQIWYQPITGKLKDNQQLITKNNHIIITGIAKEDQAFAEWIAVLEKKSWISEVRIKSYGKGLKLNSVSSFELALNIKE